MDKASLQKQIIDEIKRVSRELNIDHIAEHDFLRNSFITSYQITSAFGSWNRAVKATGLDVYHPHGESIPEEGLLLEIIRLTKELKKCPSESEMRAFGKYSPNPYIRRWGSFSKGREEAYKKYGAPDTESEIDVNESIESKKINHSNEKESFIYKKHQKPKKVQYGEPIDFRGLRHAPINEQGVVYLFGMISKDLGFIIESIRTEYPDCEGKKC